MPFCPENYILQIDKYIIVLKTLLNHKEIRKGEKRSLDNLVLKFLLRSALWWTSGTFSSGLKHQLGLQRGGWGVVVFLVGWFVVLVFLLLILFVCCFGLVFSVGWVVLVDWRVGWVVKCSLKEKYFKKSVWLAGSYYSFLMF